VADSEARWPHAKKLLWLLGVAFVLVAVAREPWTSKDTSYIDGHALRAPVVPLILRALRALLPSSIYLRAFDGLQAAVAFAATTVLAAGLSRRLLLDRVTATLVWLTLGLAQFRAVANVQSESFSYSLLSLSLAAALPLFWGERSFRALLLMTASAALLVLTRPQFVYLVPVVVLAFAVYVFTEPTWKARARAVGAGVTIAIGGLGLQALHTGTHVGVAGGAAYGGSQILAVVLTVANESDVEAIADPQVRAFASSVWRGSRDARDLANQGGDTPPALYTAATYNNIINRIFAWREGAPGEGGAEPADLRAVRGADAAALVRLNDLCIRAAVSLGRHDLLRFARLVVSEVFMWERYMNFVVVGLIVASVGRLRRSPSARLAFALALAWLVNVFFVTSVEIPDQRYTFYFDAFIAALVIGIAGHALRSQLQDGGASATSEGSTPGGDGAAAPM
jgi:hypothetical protein